MAQPNAQPNNLFQSNLNALDGRNLQLKNPWRRFFAKHIDHLLVLLLAFPFTLVGLMAFEIVKTLAYPEAGEIPEMVLNMIAFILFLTFALLYDGFLLATWGTTVGKKLMGIKVTDQNGQKLCWKDSFLRAFWCNGLICIFGIIPLGGMVFMLYQKNRLCRTSFTTWDEPNSTLVYRT